MSPEPSSASVCSTSAFVSMSRASSSGRQIVCAASGKTVRPISETTASLGLRPGLSRPTRCASARRRASSGRDVRRDLRHEPLAQRAVFGEHLAHPDRRQPRVLGEHADDRRDERTHELTRIGPGRDELCADAEHERQDAFDDKRIHELIAIAEVVVDERRRHLGAPSDCSQRRFGDALAREQCDGRVEQAFALVAARVGRAAGRTGWFSC